MATRSHTSFQKRQKEIARAEKQRDKAARRAARKLAKAEGRELEGDDLPSDPSAPAGPSTVDQS